MFYSFVGKETGRINYKQWCWLGAKNEWEWARNEWEWARNDRENENGIYCMILILESLPHIWKIQVTISNKNRKGRVKTIMEYKHNKWKLLCFKWITQPHLRGDGELELTKVTLEHSNFIIQ